MKRVLSIVLLISVLLSSLTFTALAADEIIITSADDLFTMEGNGWTESTNKGVAGPTDGTSWWTADKDAKAIYDASGLEKGSYGVYLYVTPWGTTADKVDVTITASGKATTITTNGMDGGNANRHWIFLGKYDFDGNEDDSVVQQINANAEKVNGNSDNVVMRASGVKFVKNDTNTAPIASFDATATKPAETKPATTPANDAEGIIITTADAAFSKTGAWSESTNAAVAGPTGGTSWYSTDEKATAEFDASDLEEGNYGVYFYMTPYGTTADKVDITITASGESKTIVTDGMHGGHANKHWIFLGKYDFDGSIGDGVVQKANAGATAVNGTAAKGCIRASAVKFVKDDKNTAPIDELGAAALTPAEPAEIEYLTVPETGYVTVGTAHPGFTKTGSWKESGLVMPMEGKGLYGGGEGTWYPYINKAENVEIFYFKPSATDTEDPEFKIEIFTDGEIKTVMVDFTQPPTEWYSLGRYNFSGDGSEYIRCIGSGKGTSRLTGFKFAIEEQGVDAKYKSAFFGTDLHIVERMGMLIGEGNGITEEYIKTVPTRVQAAIMVLRLNGVDAEAAAFTGTDNFADANLEPWAMPYLAYLKAHPEFGLIGTGNNMFEPTAPIDEQAYAKIVLTALGYEYDKDFTWDGTLAFAAEKGIAKAESGAFNVKDLAIMTASAFKLNCKDGSSYFEKLILERDGVADEGVYGTVLPEELKAAREAAKNKKRGIIYNNDGNDAYKAYPEYPGAFDISGLDEKTINTENFLKTRSYGLEDTQVGSVFYCTGVFNSYTHESVGITDTRVRDWSRVLKQYTGKDSLTTMVDYVHSLDKDIFWSMRMNDTHDYAYEEDELDPWKQANMDLLMYRKAEAPFMQFGNGRWTSVDYTLTPVRQVVYDILKDTLTRYDIDGLDLDFTRWPIFFKEVVDGEYVYPENIERMNNLVRMLRDLTEKVSIERNKPILLSIYVPDSIEACKMVGLDIEQWLKEGLIDIVTINCHSGSFQTWEDGIGEYKGYDVPVYACLDPLNYDNAYQNGDAAYETDKAEAALAYAAGAEGIMTYNYFDINHERFDVLGSAETVGPVPAGYTNRRKTHGGFMGKDVKKLVTLK